MQKAFEKQTKTIEDQGEKQIDALKDLKPKKAITHKLDDEDKLLHSKEREIFEDIYKKRPDKIEELIGKIDDDLKFTTLSTREKFNFTGKN